MADAGNFLWWRWPADHWTISSAEPPFIALSGGGPPVLADQSEASYYWPLEEAPDLLGDFYMLGRLVNSLLPSLRALRDDRRKLAGQDIKTLFDHPTAPYAAYAPDFHAAALRFVQQYGPLDMSVVGWSRRDGIELTEVAQESYALWVAVSSWNQMRKTVDGPLASNDPWMDFIETLQLELRSRLKGVELVPYIGAELVLVQQYICENLLAGIWLQFYESMLGGRALAFCKGCGKAFFPDRPNKEFHDSDCRNRYNVRNSLAKKRNRKEDTHGR